MATRRAGGEEGRGSRSWGEECKEDEEWRRLANHNLNISSQHLRSVLLDALLTLQPYAVVWGPCIVHVSEIDPDESEEKCSQDDANVQEIETDEFLVCHLPLGIDLWVLGVIVSSYGYSNPSLYARTSDHGTPIC
jgi:hypothetical protein